MSTNGRKSRFAKGGSPRKRTWNHKTTSQKMGNAPRDDRTLVPNPEQPYDVVRPKWGKTYPMVCRIFPNFNYDDPSMFDPTRLNTEDANAFSDWVRCVPTARWVGLDQNFTFILYDPREEREGRYSQYDNPFVILQDAFAQALQAGNAYVGRRDVMTGRWAAIDKNGNLKRASNTFFYQGLIYANAEKVYVEKKQPPKGFGERSRTQIIQMSPSGGIDLEQLVAATVEGYVGDTDDQDAYYVAGDLVDLEKGKFVTFYNPTSSAHVDALAAVLNDADYEALLDSLEEEFNSDNKGKNKGGGIGWRAVVSDTYSYRKDVFSANLAKYGWDEAASKVQWWDDLLRFPEHEEICLWLATAFRSEPGLLEWGWKDHPQFFTDEVDAVLRNRTVSASTSAGRASDDEDDYDAQTADVDDDDEDMESAQPSGRRYKVPSRYSKSAAVPAVTDDDDIEEYEVDPEVDEDVEEEAPPVAKPKKSLQATRAAIKRRMKKRAG